MSKTLMHYFLPASPAADRAAAGHPGHRGLGEWAAVCGGLARRLPLRPPLHRGLLLLRCPPRRTGPLILPEYPQPAGQTVRRALRAITEIYNTLLPVCIYPGVKGTSDVPTIKTLHP